MPYTLRSKNNLYLRTFRVEVAIATNEALIAEAEKVSHQWMNLRDIQKICPKNQKRKKETD